MSIRFEIKKRFPESILFRTTPDQKQALKWAAGAQAKSANQVLRDIVAASDVFQEWKKQKSKKTA